MEEKVVVEFINDMKQTHVDLEIPLEITGIWIGNGYREYFQLLSCC